MTATIDRPDGYRAKLQIARKYTARKDFKDANPLFFLQDYEGFMDFFNALYAAFLASDARENQLEAFKDMYEYLTREHMIASNAHIHAIFMLASGAVFVPKEPKPVSSSVVQNFKIYVMTAALEYHNFEKAMTNVYLDARDCVDLDERDNHLENSSHDQPYPHYSSAFGNSCALEAFFYYMMFVSYKIAVLEPDEHIKNMVTRPCLRLCAHELINSTRFKSDEWRAECFKKAELFMLADDEWVRHVEGMCFLATELAKTVPRLQQDVNARTVSHIFL
eukprot:1168201-Pleurochrysis_carterae.AAC.1